MSSGPPCSQLDFRRKRSNDDWDCSFAAEAEFRPVTPLFPSVRGPWAAFWANLGRPGRNQSTRVVQCNMTC